MTVAVTLFALLELYKRGEASWQQEECFGEIAVSAVAHEPPLTVARVTRGAPAPAPRRGRRPAQSEEPALEAGEEVPA